jgi:hypothetical protein
MGRGTLSEYWNLGRLHNQALLSSELIGNARATGSMGERARLINLLLDAGVIEAQWEANKLVYYSTGQRKRIKLGGLNE